MGEIRSPRGQIRHWGPFVEVTDPVVVLSGRARRVLTTSLAGLAVMIRS